MKRSMLFMVLVSLLLCGLSAAAELPGETKYFATVSGTVPLELTDELARAEALTRTSYYVGDYDSHGQLISVRKVSQGATTFFHAYTYNSSGLLVEARITNAQGKTSLYRRDQSGPLQPVPGD